MVTPHEIEGLFAADLAFLQDFYGVINFGNQQEYEEFARRAAGGGAAAGSVRSPPAGAGSGAGVLADGPPRPGRSARAGRARVEEIPTAARYDPRCCATRSTRSGRRSPILAYHLHWPMDELLDLEHMDRVRMVRAVPA